MDVLKYGRSLSPAQIIVYSFALFILAGTALLMLPAATVDGAGATFTDALFTIVSAVCVTGLSVQDTGTYWTFFGQAVILFAIQVGGLGVVTAAISLTVFSGRKIGLMQRNTMQEALAAPQLKGIVQLVLFILKYVAIIELVGTLLLYTVFAPQYGWVTGWWYAMFHAISAFCNAGFDIMGPAGGGSLTTYEFNPVVNTVIMLLIIIGGLGFLVWENIARKRSLRKFSVYTKLVLLITAALLAVGWAGTCLLEWNNPETLGGMTVGEKLLNGFFQSATLRTAGFAAIDQAKLTESGKAFSSVLMFIGGSSGSTAGGIKTVTFLVLVLTIWARARGKSTVCAFKRTIPDEQTQNAMIIAFIVLALAVFGGIFISATSPMGFTDAVYEAVSALATVGLSAGGTASLSIPAQILIIIYMYFGRVGVLTISLGFLAGNRAEERFRYAETNLLIG